MAKPQQPELHRSGKGATDPASAKSHVDTGGATTDAGTGPIPEDNLPGHHPDHEQDKPVRKYRQRAKAVVAEAEAEQAEQAARRHAERTVTEGKISARGMTFRTLEAGPQAVQVTYEDTAPPFNPLVHPVQTGKIGGLGVLLARELATAREYAYLFGRNRLRLAVLR